MKAKHLLIIFALLGCSADQEPDISYLQGSWECKTRFEFEGGWVADTESVVEADVAMMTYTKSANIISHYPDRSPQKSILHYKAECQFFVNGDYMTVSCQPTETKVIQDDFSMLTPRFVDGFKTTFKPDRAKVIKISDTELKFESTKNSKNTAFEICRKQK